MDDDALVRSLRTAVEAAPEDVPLRLHLAQLLLDAGDAAGCVAQAAAVLQREPGSGPASALVAAGSAALTGQVPPTAAGPVPPPPVAGAGSRPGFDWARAERDLGDVVPPRYVDGSGADDADGPGAAAYDVERPTLTLADVGGMTEVKERLEAAFLAPMRNPELRRLYGKSLRGGLLLYGPPGCGKTFLARALAGELGAGFVSVGLADVLDMYVGQSERNLSAVFDLARRSAPCVLFLDEVDALGQKRSHLRGSAMRTTVNTLLSELDGVAADNEGVFVLAATNAPWDVDVALRRPGRFDRTVLVLPPDAPARQSVLAHHLRDRPVAGVDLGRLAARTDGLSGADLAHVCETAAEAALLDSVRSGQPRLIGQADLEAAAAALRPSTGPWFETARNVALFANASGEYDDLLAHLKRTRRL